MAHALKRPHAFFFLLIFLAAVRVYKPGWGEGQVAGSMMSLCTFV